MDALEIVRARGRRGRLAQERGRGEHKHGGSKPIRQQEQAQGSMRLAKQRREEAHAAT